MDARGETQAVTAGSDETRVKRLGQWDAVNIIIGIVVGAGLYETAPLVYANVPSAGAGMAVWLLGGVLSLIGALCYAELATTYPKSGGDYAYLTRAFGPLAGFLFGWAQLAILMTGSIGMMAYVFADYAGVLWGFDGHTGALLAAAAIVALSVLNLRGAVVGKALQNVLTGLKIIGVLAVTIAGLFWSSPAAAGATRSPAEAAAGGGSLGLAMILVLYTYGGWNDAAFVAADIRDRERNIPKALVLGTGAVTLIYLVVNSAFLYGLGFEQARSSRAIAADVLSGPLGAWGAKVMCVVVMISALGAVNGLIFTGTRVYASLGADYSVVRRLGRWNERFETPVTALVAQAAVAVLLVGLVGTTAGRAVIDQTLVLLGMSAAAWTGHGGFDTLLRCTAPVFWVFFFLTGLSLFVLRSKDRDLPRAFSVPLYPLLPIIFCAMCLAMLYSAVEYAGKLVVFGILPLIVGVPLFFASKRRPESPSLPLLVRSENPN
jgi:amino acid transporter